MDWISAWRGAGKHFAPQQGLWMNTLFETAGRSAIMRKRSLPQQFLSRFAHTVHRIAILGALLMSPDIVQAAAPPPMTPRYAISSDGARIAYYATSAPKAPATPLLVLSGGPGTDHRYMRVGGALDAIGRSRRLFFFDQRGTSNSSDAVDPTIDRYVEDIEAVRKATGAERLDMLGHSFGGYLAFAYAARHPERVRSLILVGSAMPKAGDEQQLMDVIYPERFGRWREQRAALPPRFPAPMLALFQSMEFVDQAALVRFLEAVKGYTYNISANNALRADMTARNYWPQVRALRVPVLVTHGRFDTIVSTRNSWSLHEAIPNSEFHVFEESGHLPHVERPDEFRRRVLRFLQAVDRRQQ